MILTKRGAPRRPKMASRRIRMFVDGACDREHFGGWGAVILPIAGSLQTHKGGLYPATNQTAEMEAAIHGLQQVHHQFPEAILIEVVSDSKYVIRGITEWVYLWQLNGWTTGDGSPVSNQDLWHQLMALDDPLRVIWTHVRGHKGHVYNEMADKLAVKARQNARLNPASIVSG